MSGLTEKGLSHKQINRWFKDQGTVLEGLGDWAEQTAPGNNAKLKKALAYLYNCRDVMMTYLENGHYSLSENSICPVTIGRRNWLFSGTPDGAATNSLYLTIVEMAKV